MPPARRTTARNAQRFSAWLRRTAPAAGITTQADLRIAWAKSYPDDRKPSSGEVSNWWNGLRVPFPATVRRLAILLGADPDEAETEAGYETKAAPPHARTWSQWIVPTAEAAGYDPQRIAEDSDGTLKVEAVEDWWHERAVPTPTAVMLVAAILGADHLEALRAAGEEELAEQIHALTLLADPAVRALDRYDLPADARRRLIREYDKNKQRGVEQAAEILHLKAAQAAPGPDDSEHPTPGRDAL